MMTRAELTETLDAYREAIRAECEPGLDDMALGHAIRRTEAIRRVLDYELGILCASSHAPRRVVTTGAFQ